MAAPRAVFFDAAGTLFETRRPVGETYAALAGSYGKEVLAAEIQERFRRTFATMPPLAFSAAGAAIAELERGWWREFVRRVFEPYGPFPDFDSYFARLFSHFARASSWILYPETIEVLAALRARGLDLGVISNFDSRLRGILEGLGIDRYFSAVVLSSEAGYAKPSKEIFAAALARLRIEDPATAMHVGDAPENDALGAARAGLIGVLVRRDGKPADGPFYAVQDLRGILPLIESL
jgi:putative hydrolase of the HAD superfamily